MRRALRRCWRAPRCHSGQTLKLRARPARPEFLTLDYTPAVNRACARGLERALGHARVGGAAPQTGRWTCTTRCACGA